MDIKGRVVSIGESIKDKETLITFAVDSVDVSEFGDEELSIQIQKYREGRSHNANALLWECLSEIAHYLHANKWKVYLMMLRRYGRFTYICVPEDGVDEIERAWRETEIVGEFTSKGKKMVEMLCYAGSSSYNTLEFSRLLNGVIAEMVEMGLVPPTEKQRDESLEKWRVDHGEEYASVALEGFENIESAPSEEKKESKPQKKEIRLCFDEDEESESEEVTKEVITPKEAKSLLVWD